MSRFVQICLDWCGWVRILGELFRLSVDGSQSVWVAVQATEAAGAGQRALVLCRSADVPVVSVGIDPTLPLVEQGVGVVEDGVGVVGRIGLRWFVRLEFGHRSKQEAQFAGGGDGLAVLVGVAGGLGEALDLVGESVRGDGAEDVGAVALEVAEVVVDGGAGATELFGDFVGRESLAVEVVGFEDASAASGGGRPPSWAWLGLLGGDMYVCSDCAGMGRRGQEAGDTVGLRGRLEVWAPHQVRGIGGGTCAGNPHPSPLPEGEGTGGRGHQME